MRREIGLTSSFLNMFNAGQVQSFKRPWLLSCGTSRVIGNTTEFGSCNVAADSGQPPWEGAAAAAYAHHKETYLATAQTCERQGILFLPMVVETSGNWDARAYKGFAAHRARGGQPHWHGSCDNLVYAPSRGQGGSAGLSSQGGFAPSGRIGISIVCLSSPWTTMEHA